MVVVLRFTVFAVILCVVGGCGRLGFDPRLPSGFDPAPDASQSPFDGGARTSEIDGAPVAVMDGSVIEPIADSGVVPVDADQDAGAVVDGGAPDSGSVGYEFCPAVDGNTIALFKAENPSSFIDETGTHSGTLVGNPVAVVGGAPACGGEAYNYSNLDWAYATVANSPSWELTSGSVEFWLYLTEYAGDGIVCRDASGFGEGHFTVVVGLDGDIVARIEDGTREYVRCGRRPLPLNTWHHVGVNFGPNELELFIDGVPGDRVGNVSGVTPGWSFSCTANGGAPNGLRGNTNPWVFGGLCWRSVEGTNSSVGNILRGYLDEMRISDVQRPFDQ